MAVARAVLVLLLASVLGCSATSSPSPTGSAIQQSTASTSGSAAPPGSSSASPTAPGSDAPNQPLDLDHVAIALEPFARVPDGPLAMTHLPDASGRLFVAAQDGRAWVIQDGKVLPDPLLDLRSELRPGGEQGLLGIAVPPKFPADPRVFVDYTDTNGDTVVASLRIDPENPNRVDPASEQRILFVDQPFPNHNGGAVVFGPDGYLYVSLGDGGGGGDPQRNGQNTNVLLGKILRLDIDATSGDQAYGIPSGNPFASGGGRPEIWA